MSTEKRSFADYPHRVLIMLCGTSPAVITETLYALITAPEAQRFVPTRLRIITTTEGKTALEEQLLDVRVPPKPVDGRGRPINWIQKFNVDMNVSPPIRLSLDADVIVPKLEDGSEIEDAHTQEEISAMRDLISSELLEHTGDDDTAVHFSLSGGRKSMGHLAGQAMTAMARKWDRLIHVVVKPSWLEMPGVHFFYPGYPQQHRHPEERRRACFPFDPKNANADSMERISVELSYEPLLRLPEDLRRRIRGMPNMRFGGLITDQSSDREIITLSINRKWSGQALLGDNMLRVLDDGKHRLLHPWEYAFLIVLATRRKLTFPLDDQSVLEILQAYDVLKTAAAARDDTESWGIKGRLVEISNFFPARKTGALPPLSKNEMISKDAVIDRCHFYEPGTKVGTSDQQPEEKKRGRFGPISTAVSDAIVGALPLWCQPAEFQLTAAPKKSRQLNDIIGVKWIK